MAESLLLLLLIFFFVDDIFMLECYVNRTEYDWLILQ